MECLLCGRPISPFDESGICASCSDEPKTSDTIFTSSPRRYLTRRELGALRSELDELVNE